VKGVNQDSDEFWARVRANFKARGPTVQDGTYGDCCKQPSRIVRPMSPLASPRLAITNQNTSLIRNQVKDSRTCSHYTYGPFFVTKEPALPNQMHSYSAPTQFDTTKIPPALETDPPGKQSATIQTILSSLLVSQSRTWPSPKKIIRTAS
jgi:hypothetical protein